MVATDILGWFSDADARSYNELVNMIHDGILVEVGSYQGKSIGSIIQTCKKNNISVIAVDLWGNNFYDSSIRILVDHLYKVGFSVPTKRRFLANIRELGFHVEALKTSSQKASQIIGRRYGKKSLAGVFIDAQHDYGSVLQDIFAWTPLVRDGGWIAGHDFGGEWDGVERAVNEVFQGHHKTLPSSIWYHKVDRKGKYANTQ